MNYLELARRINQRVSVGLKTSEDRAEFLKLDEKLLNFMGTANQKDFENFRRRCYAHEAFSMIVAHLTYEGEK